MAEDALFDDLDTDIYEIYAGNATFDPNDGGDVVSCNIDISVSLDEQPQDFNGRTFPQRTIVRCLLVEVGDVEPDKESFFVKNGVTYTVEGIQENNGSDVKCFVKVS